MGVDGGVANSAWPDGMHRPVEKGIDRAHDQARVAERRRVGHQVMGRSSTRRWTYSRAGGLIRPLHRSRGPASCAAPRGRRTAARVPARPAYAAARRHARGLCRDFSRNAAMCASSRAIHSPSRWRSGGGGLRSVGIVVSGAMIRNRCKEQSACWGTDLADRLAGSFVSEKIMSVASTGRPKTKTKTESAGDARGGAQHRGAHAHAPRKRDVAWHAGGPEAANDARDGDCGQRRRDGQPLWRTTAGVAAGRVVVAGAARQ